MQVREAQAVGLPIGWDYFPFCGGSVQPKPCGVTGVGWLLQFVKWTVMALVAGLLIGLGGPFW